MILINRENLMPADAFSCMPPTHLEIMRRGRQWLLGARVLQPQAFSRQNIQKTVPWKLPVSLQSRFYVNQQSEIRLSLQGPVILRLILVEIAIIRFCKDSPNIETVPETVVSSMIDKQK